MKAIGNPAFGISRVLADFASLEKQVVKHKEDAKQSLEKSQKNLADKQKKMESLLCPLMLDRIDPTQVEELLKLHKELGANEQEQEDSIADMDTSIIEEVHKQYNAWVLNEESEAQELQLRIHAKAALEIEVLKQLIEPQSQQPPGDSNPAPSSDLGLAKRVPILAGLYMHLEKCNRKLEHDRKAAEKELKALKAKAKEQNDALKQINERAGKKNQEVKELDNTLQDLANIIQYQEERKGKLKAENSHMDAENKTLNEKKEELDYNIAQQKKECQDLANKIAELTKKRDTTQDSASKMVSECEKLNSKKDKLITEVEEQQKKAEKARSETQDLEEKLNKKKEEYKSQIDAKEKDKDALKKKLETLQTSINGIQKKFEQLNTIVDMDMERVQQIHQQIELAKQNCKLYTDRERDLSEKYKKTLKMWTTLSETIEAERTQVKDLQTDIDTLRGQLAQELHSGKPDISKIETAKKDLGTHIDMLGRKYVELREKCRSQGAKASYEQTSSGTLVFVFGKTEPTTLSFTAGHPVLTFCQRVQAPSGPSAGKSADQSVLVEFVRAAGVNSIVFDNVFKTQEELEKMLPIIVGIDTLQSVYIKSAHFSRDTWTTLQEAPKRRTELLLSLCSTDPSSDFDDQSENIQIDKLKFKIDIKK